MLRTLRTLALGNGLLLSLPLFVSGCSHPQQAPAPVPAPEPAPVEEAASALEAESEAPAEEAPEGFVLVEAGSFMMGSPSDELGRIEEYSENETQRSTTLTHSFYMQATLVTQGQWEALLGNNPSHFDSCGDDCPVEQVSWWDAAAYANALSQRDGLEECYSLAGCSGEAGDGLSCEDVEVAASDLYLCEGYRLPTEAEWEFAARAGTTTATHAGDLTATDCDDETAASIAWFCGNAADSTHPVAQKAANAWGLYDMSGNAWEWVWDWYEESYGDDASDPAGPESGARRVRRGGGWNSRAQGVRAALRSHDFPLTHRDDLGFRVVRTVR